MRITDRVPSATADSIPRYTVDRQGMTMASGQLAGAGQACRALKKPPLQRRPPCMRSCCRRGMITRTSTSQASSAAEHATPHCSAPIGKEVASITRRPGTGIRAACSNAANAGYRRRRLPIAPRSSLLVPADGHVDIGKARGATVADHQPGADVLEMKRRARVVVAHRRTCRHITLRRECVLRASPPCWWKRVDCSG